MPVTPSTIITRYRASRVGISADAFVSATRAFCQALDGHTEASTYALNFERFNVTGTEGVLKELKTFAEPLGTPISFSCTIRGRPPAKFAAQVTLDCATQVCQAQSTQAPLITARIPPAVLALKNHLPEGSESDEPRVTHEDAITLEMEMRRLLAEASALQGELSTTHVHLQTIEDILGKIHATKASADDLAHSIAQCAKEIQAEHTKVLQTSGKIFGEEGAIEATRNRITELSRTVELSTAEVTAEAKAFTNFLDTLRPEKAEIEKTLEETKNLLMTTTAAALHTSFENNRKTLGRWQAARILAIITLSSVIAFLSTTYITIEKVDAALIIARLLFLGPLLFLDWFLVTDYRQNQKFLESYRYKSALAQSLPAFRNLAGGHTDADAFMSQALQRINSEPLPERSTPASPETIKLISDTLKSTIETIPSIVTAARPQQSQPPPPSPPP